MPNTTTGIAHKIESQRTNTYSVRPAVFVCMFCVVLALLPLFSRWFFCAVEHRIEMMWWKLWQCWDASSPLFPLSHGESLSFSRVAIQCTIDIVFIHICFVGFGFVCAMLKFHLRSDSYKPWNSWWNSWCSHTYQLLLKTYNEPKLRVCVCVFAADERFYNGQNRNGKTTFAQT